MQTKRWKNEIRLIHNLILHKIQLQFSDQLFGYMWAILNPLMYIFSFWFFAYVGFKGGTVFEIPFVVWFVPGVLIYRYLSTLIGRSPAMLSSNASLIKETQVKAVYIPLIESVKEMYVHIGVMFVMFIIYAIIGFSMTKTWNYLPTIYYINFIYYWITATAFSIVLAYCLSILGIMFRDIKNIVSAILVPLFWMTPVLFPVEHGVNPTLELLEKIFNPVYYFINGYRNTMLYGQFFYQDVLYNIYIWIIITILGLCARVMWKFIYPLLADLV